MTRYWDLVSSFALRSFLHPSYFALCPLYFLKALRPSLFALCTFFGWYDRMATPTKADLCERTFRFALSIVRFYQALPQRSGVAQTLGKQLLRSGTSIGANVEEGQGSQSRADFASKYAIARKEARETHYWLRLIEEAGLAEPTRVTPLLAECSELIAILTAIVKKVRSTQ